MRVDTSTEDGAVSIASLCDNLRIQRAVDGNHVVENLAKTLPNVGLGRKECHHDLARVDIVDDVHASVPCESAEEVKDTHSPDKTLVWVGDCGNERSRCVIMHVHVVSELKARGNVFGRL